MVTREEMPACPVATTVALIGSKWKLLIMRNLLVRPWRFNELQKDLAGISQKVLTDSLRALEEHDDRMELERERLEIMRIRATGLVDTDGEDDPDELEGMEIEDVKEKV